MSKDEPVVEPGISVDHDSVSSQNTAGAILRTARQAQGLDIATLAVLLKVPGYKLQALEQDQSELLADPVFARALAASMCRILKLDASSVLQRLPAIAAFKVTSQNRGINTPFRSRSGKNVLSFWSHLSRPAVLLGLALLLGALVLIFLPSLQKEISRYRQAGQFQTVPGQGGGSAAALTTVVTPTFAGNDVSGASGMTESTADTPVTLSVAEALPFAANVDSGPVEPPMTISARGTSQIKVTDARGTVIFDRSLRAGESVSLSGILPLVVVASRASVLQVQVRGQAFDLASVTKNNTARFEVK